MIQIAGQSPRTWRRYILVILPVLLYMVVMWSSRPRQTSTPVARARPRIQPALQRRSTEKKEAGQSVPTMLTHLSPPPAHTTLAPLVQTPPAQKPAAQKPAPQKPAPQKPAPQKPAPQKPAPQKPAAQTPPAPAPTLAASTPAASTPTAPTSAAQSPLAPMPAAKTPAASSPGAKTPATAMSVAPASTLTPAAPAPASTPVASMSVTPPSAPASTPSVATSAPKPSGPKCQDGYNALRLATKSSESVACAKDSASNPTNKGKLKFPVTIVTCYYRIRSKRPATTYMRWLKLFLHRIATPIAFYTNCDTLASVLPVVRDREQLFPGRTFADVLNLEETPLARRFGPVLRRQEARDGERFAGHNYLLYLVWLMKTEAMMASIRENRFCSEWFLWVDGGAFRSEYPLKNWPSPRRMDMIPKDRALYEAVVPFGNQANIRGLPKDGSLDKFLIDNRGTFYQNHLAGGFIGLNVRQGFHLKFYKLLTDMYQTFVDHDFMIVKDQSVFHALFLKQPELFALIQSNWECGDAWFHALPWLADKTEMNCLHTAPLLLLP